MKKSVLSSFLTSKLLRGSFTALLFSSAVVGMNGCATVEGAGEAIEEGAEDASN